MGTLNVVFQWLIQASFHASVLIGIILLLGLIFRNKLPGRWHYFLWLLVIARLMMPWVPESRMSLFNLIRPFPPAITALQSVPTASEESPGISNRAEIPPDTVEPFRLPPMNDTKSTLPPPNLNEPIQTAASPTVAEPVKTWTIVDIIPFVWLTGAGLLAIYVLCSNLRLWRIVKSRRPVTDQKILDLLEDCKQQMHIQTILGVIETDKAKSPSLFGFIRPRLLLPQGLIQSVSDGELRYIFLHELAHLKRHDIFVGWIMAALQVLHWFNPLVWLAFHRMRADRELACDGLALSTIQADQTDQTDIPAEYGRTIIRLLEKHSDQQILPGLAGILENKSQLKRRLTMIINFNRKSYRWSALAVILIAILACAGLTNAHWPEKLNQRVPGDLQEKLLVYYSFDKDGGTRTPDLTGMDFHGKVNGAQHIDQGVKGGGLVFDGRDDHIAIGELALKHFTFTAWVKPNEGLLNNRRIFMLDGGEKEFIAVEGNSANSISVYITDDVAVNEHHCRLLPGQWTHLAVTFDGEQVKIYHNGQLKKTGPAPYDKTFTGQATLGYSGDSNRQAGNFCWDGMMDEVALYNYAISDTEVSQLYKKFESASESTAFPFADLQQQIDNAQPGATLIIPNGIYTKPISIKKNITLKGESLNGCHFEVTANAPAILVDTAGKGKVTIENITFKWQLATSDRHEMPFTIAFKDSTGEIKNCNFFAAGNSQRSPVAVRAMGFSDLTISQCTTQGYEYVICYGEGTKGTMQDCVITDCGHQGIILYSGAEVNVLRNVITGSGYHAVRSTGGILHMQDNLIINNKNRGVYLGNKSGRGEITNNAIIGNASGIDGFGQSAYTIKNNVIKDNTFSGIAMRDTSRLEVSKNILMGNKSGITLFGDQLGGNEIKSNLYWGNQADNVRWIDKNNSEQLDIAHKAIEPDFQDPENGNFAWKANGAYKQFGLTDPMVIIKLWQKWQISQVREVQPTSTDTSTSPTRPAWRNDLDKMLDLAQEYHQQIAKAIKERDFGAVKKYSEQLEEIFKEIQQSDNIQELHEQYKKTFDELINKRKEAAEKQIPKIQDQIEKLLKDLQKEHHEKIRDLEKLKKSLQNRYQSEQPRIKELTGKLAELSDELSDTVQNKKEELLDPLYQEYSKYWKEFKHTPQADKDNAPANGPR